MTSRLRVHLFALLALSVSVAGVASAQDGEPVLLVDLLDNGDFAEPVPTHAPEAVPWWRVRTGAVELVLDASAPRLATGPGASVVQPVAGFAPLAGGVAVRGHARGPGRLLIRSGRRVVPFEVDGAFEVAGSELASIHGEGAMPRFELELTTPAGPAGPSTDWSALSFVVPLPCPSPPDLRTEIVARLDEAFGTWLANGLDEEGPVATGFACHAFDVVTGERLFSFPGGAFDLWTHLMDALELHEDPRWRAAFERFVASYLERIPHPETGLPRRWDCVNDAPLDGRWVEIGADLELLVDLAERGPERFREAARAAAVKMADQVLEVGVLPDGAIAPKFRAADAAASTAAPPLRRLDVPAQLARLAALVGDERYLVAARNAVAEVEFTHDWPGTWRNIDPGFDDDYGHYGARAATMWAAHPDEAAFRNLALSGFWTYAPLWRDALRLGGNVAADQVRCWRTVIELAKLDEDVLPEVRRTLPMAVRAHFKGEQYDDGAWGDVTHVGFDPQADLNVGDLTGVPANLLWGLGLAADPDLGLPADELRAMFTAVLRSSVEAYRRPHGYLRDRHELPEHNRAGGELRLCTGLIAMLRHVGAE